MLGTVKLPDSGSCRSVLLGIPDTHYHGNHTSEAPSFSLKIACCHEMPPVSFCSCAALKKEGKCPLPPPIMDPNLTWIVIYQMLLMLLPSSITPLSETGPITSETSILHSRVAMTERARHASRAAMPAPEIRRLQFNFPSPSLSLSLSTSVALPLSSTPSSPVIGDMYHSIFYLFHQNRRAGILISPRATYFLQLPLLSPTAGVIVISLVSFLSI